MGPRYLDFTHIRRLSGIIVNTMIETTRQLAAGFCIAVLLVLSACATGKPSVVERLDEETLVTVTHNRTPIVMSTDTPFSPRDKRDYVELGAVEVNRMGDFQYFLWLGISEVVDTEDAEGHPEGFDSIVFYAGDENIQLDVFSWTHRPIGTSERIYRKLFSTSVDAYYEITLDQIQWLADRDVIKLRTSGAVPREFVLWQKADAAKSDLAEFLKNVLQ